MLYLENKKRIVWLLLTLIFLGGAVLVESQEVKKDFVVSPAKVEVSLEPGESQEILIFVKNRLGEDKTFFVEKEDFAGSKDGQAAVLLGDERGIYSGKDYIEPQVEEIFIKEGEQESIPVKVSIPSDAETGGVYASVLIGTGNIEGTVNVLSRIGTLFFVTVSGEVEREGSLEEFVLKGNKKVVSRDSLIFHILYENNGNVHNNPYGIIEIKNMFGRKVDEIILDPWFVLPDSLRLREVVWEKEGLFGRYTANLKLNLGYENIVEEKSLSFWVISWWKLILSLVGLVIVVVVIKKIRRK